MRIVHRNNTLTSAWAERTVVSLNHLPISRDWYPAIVWGLIALVSAALSLLPRLPNPTIAAFVGILYCAALWSIAHVAPGGLWSPPTVFLVVIGAFHLGLLPYWISGADPQLPLPSDLIWYQGALGGVSLFIVLAGVVGFAGGVHVVYALFPPLPSIPKYRDDSEAAVWVAMAGAFTLSSAVGVWFVESVRAGGLEVFTNSYYYFLDSTAGTVVGAMEFPILVGLGLLMVGRFRSYTYVALALFAAFGVCASLIGVRGGVLYPIAIAVTVLAFRRTLARPPLAVALSIVMLSIVSIVRRVREVGLATYSGDLLTLNPFAGLAELGGSIRIIAIVTQWHGEEGEPYRWGATYTVAVARALEALFAPNVRPPGVDDDRLFNQLVLSRQGPLGGSVIGEALHNFGPAGVFFVLVLLGGILAYFSATVRSVWQAALYVVVAGALMYHVRNDFTPVIPWIIAGAISLYILRFAYTTVRSRVGELEPEQW